MTDSVQIIECPRDAWQGLAEIIPTEVKVDYLLQLAAAGFKHIDAVSFVSPQHVRQMADSEEVMKGFLAGLPEGTKLPEIIGIVLNERGVERALATPGVTTLGYPYSISAYFRRANANMSRGESRAIVEELRKATKASGHGLVIYISMAFGNPYDEPWGPEIVEDTLVWLKDIGVRTVSLADTVGNATPDHVGAVYGAVKECVKHRASHHGRRQPAAVGVGHVPRQPRLLRESRGPDRRDGHDDDRRGADGQDTESRAAHTRWPHGRRAVERRRRH